LAKGIFGQFAYSHNREEHLLGRLNRDFQAKGSAAGRGAYRCQQRRGQFQDTGQAGEYRSGNYEATANRVDTVLDAVGGAVEIISAVE
jgi:hypothetical protein